MVKMFVTILKSQTLSHFEDHIKNWLEAGDSDVHDKHFIDLVNSDKDIWYICEQVICMQKWHMRRKLFMRPSISIQMFIERK
jgi:hypothetical protein